MKEEEQKKQMKGDEKHTGRIEDKGNNEGRGAEDEGKNKRMRETDGKKGKIRKRVEEKEERG